MSAFLKRYVHLVGAALCAVAIIAFAFYARSHNTTTPSGAVVVSGTLGNGVLSVTDEDGNGAPDWQDELVKNVIASVSTSTDPFKTDEPYTPPTTFTGKFAEGFFKDYLVRKGAGETFDDPTELIMSAVQSIDKNTASKQHSRLEVVIVPDTPAEIREYSNALGKILLAHPTHSKENEGMILTRALQANDPLILQDLARFRTAYEGVIHDTLLVPTPEALVPAHINILNAYEAILLDIRAMELAFEDPLYALARLDKYMGDAGALITAFKSLSAQVSKNGITYTKDEPGSFLYLFDTLNP